MSYVIHYTEVAVNEGIEGEQIDKCIYTLIMLKKFLLLILLQQYQPYKVTAMKLSYGRHEMIAGTVIRLEAE